MTIKLESKSKWWSSDGQRPESNLCDCGAILPEAEKEMRQGGYFEFVTECRVCGATYTD